MQQPIRESLSIFCNYFRLNNIPYVIVGGVAVLFFGRARMTTDVDILIDHTKLNKDHFINEMVNKGWSLLGVMESDGFTLNFDKEEWIATVIVKSSLAKSKIEILVGPK